MNFFSLIPCSITQVETGEHFTRDEFNSLIETKKNYFSQTGIVSGTRILLLQCNSIEFFINLIALFRIGATVIPLDELASPLELENVKKHSCVEFVITAEQLIKVPSVDSIDTNGVALIMYTSGTTGNPKGILIGYDQLVKKLEVLSLHISSEERKNAFCALPTFFGHGLICNSLFPLFYGENFFIAKKFDLNLISSFPEYLEKYKISFFSTVPSVWNLIFSFSSEYKGKDLRRVHCASSPLNREMANRILLWLGADVKFFNIFGITEMLGWFAARKITKEEPTEYFSEFWNTETDFTEEGELLLRSEYMFSGYLSNEQCNLEAFDSRGFFRTGDIFKSGMYLGRLKLTINKKGIKVYPQEIDLLLQNSGLLVDCYTFAIPNKMANENIGILVVLKEQISLEEIKTFCRKSLSSVKIPDQFFVVDKIPRNARGKIAREQLLSYQNRVEDDQ